MSEMVFGKDTRVICGGNRNCVTICYRKMFACEGGSAVVRIAAEGTFALYINGAHVQTRLTKSYDFHKLFDEIDISRFVKPGENCIAVESRWALIAEIFVNGVSVCHTDESFRCTPNPALKADTLGTPAQTTLKQEEWFDGRREMVGWQTADFDDSGWDNAQNAEAQMNWKGYTLYQADLLTNTPKYGKQMVAELLCRRIPGEKMCLRPVDDRKYEKGVDDEYQIYITEVLCEKDTYLRVSPPGKSPRMSVDGAESRFYEQIPLSKGAHLVCMSVIGDCELIIDAPDAVLSGRALCGEECKFAGIGFVGKSVKYPWHETSEDIARQIPDLNIIHGCDCAEQLAGKYPFRAVKPYGESAWAEIILQDVFFPRGGEYPNGLLGERKIAPVDVKSPFVNSRHLLNGKGNFCEIRNESEYDAFFIVDLGIETCGHINMALEAQEGQIIDVHVFEVIDGLGIFFMPQENGIRYVARGGYQEYRSLGRFGGRYMLVCVRGKGAVRIHDIHMDETLYPVDRKGTFACSDEQLNNIFKMCIDTSALCMLDTYVDCPGHEQSVWTGDADITARNNLIHFGAYDFNQQDNRLVAQSITDEFVKQYYPNDERYLSGKFLTAGALPAYPEGGLPMWSFLWLLQTWEHYLYSGNREDLIENYETVKVSLDHADRMINSRGLFDMQGAWNLIEWANNDLSTYGEVTANNVLLVNSYRIGAWMSKELGFEAEAEVYTRKAETLCENINRYCWNEEKQGYVDTVRDEYGYREYCLFYEKQGLATMSFEEYMGCMRVSEHANVMALLYDCVPEERKQNALAIAARVKDCIFRGGAPSQRTVGAPKEGETRDGIVMVGSPFFLYFSLGALWKYHLNAEALHVVRNVWGYMLERGTNTCWESLEKVKGAKRFTRSIAHAWSAGPSIYLSEEVLGIKPVEPGYRRFTIQPDLCDLTWAKGSVATPYGTIYVSIRKKDDGSLEITHQAPAECELV